MENDLDRIAEGDTPWQPVIGDFYEPFHTNLANKYNEINKKDLMPEEKSNEVCDKCGAPMVIKTGRYGKFLACSAYPKCKNIKSLNGNGNSNGLSPEKNEELEKLSAQYAGRTCEKCGSPMAVKTGRYGPFLACTAYPKCKNIVNIKAGGGPTGITCPACGQGEIVPKRSRRGIFYACNRYPECKNAYWAKPTGDKCPDCGALLVTDKSRAVKCSNKECGYVK
jgi:DNA topoisomerase-1